MTVVVVEDVGACWLACRSLAQEASMDSQLIVGAERTLGEWELPGAVEVTVIHEQKHRKHMELMPGPVTRREDVRKTGVADEHRAPLPAEPSTTKKRGNSSINVLCSGVG
jgi:hypothetical protein